MDSAPAPSPGPPAFADPRALAALPALCRRFGVSRNTGYKWLARYERGGVESLKDQSRAPLTCPHQTATPVEQALLQARREHPTWGPKKLLAYLERRRPNLAARLPAPSTVGEILKAQGLSHPRKRPARSWKHPAPEAYWRESGWQVRWGA